MKIEIIPLSDITPYANNPRDNEAAVDAVARSIKEYGFRQPIVVDPDGVIVAGDTRYKAAKRLGLDTVPVHRADLTPRQIAAYRLEDNKSGELADWDFSKLKIELDSLKSDEFDFGSLSFSTEELAEAGHGPEEPPDEPPVEPPDDYEPVTEPGELIELGAHRLLCGDSTKVEDVELLMGGETPRLMVTDPPYGVSYSEIIKSRGNQKEGGWDDIENDSLSAEELEALLKGALACESAKVAFVWHPPGAKRWAFWSALEYNGWNVSQEIIWVKNALVFGRADYQWRHEPCMYAKREGAGRQEDRTQTTVWEINKQSNANHPTQKPLECMARPIRNHEGDVYDPFLGSGTTLIAAENLNRRCYGIEISPRYVDVCVVRYLKHIGPDKHPELAEKYERLLQL